MRQRQLLYQLSFYINLLAVLLFFGIVLFNLYENLQRNNGTKDFLIGVVIMLLFLAIYILHDFTGFFLVKKVFRKERILQRTAAFIWVLSIVHLLLILITGYGVYDLYKTIYSWPINREQQVVIPPMLYVLFFVIVSIFLSGIYNAIAIMVFNRRSRKTREQFDELINEIGSRQ